MKRVKSIDFWKIFFILCVLLILAIPSWIIAEIIHYNLEPRHRIGVTYTIYDNGTVRKRYGVFTIAGDKYEVLNYWRSRKHSKGHRVVSIVDANHWGAYISQQSVCIYTGLGDVEVNEIKIVE